MRFSGVLAEHAEQFGGRDPIAAADPEHPDRQLALACELEDRRSFLTKGHADDRPDRDGGMRCGIGDEAGSAWRQQMSTAWAAICVGLGCAALTCHLKMRNRGR